MCGMARSTHHVEAGDAIYFDANTIHSYVCTGKTPATAVIVTLQHPLLQLGNGIASDRPGELERCGACRRRCCLRGWQEEL